MTYVTTPETETVIEHLKADLAAIELDVTTSYTLADAMRSGAKRTEQKVGGWGEGVSACALSTAWLDAVARGYIA